MGLGSFNQTQSKILHTSIGAGLITLALFPANWTGLGGLLLLWSVAGNGQALINVPIWIIALMRLRPSRQQAMASGLWHDHEHDHDEQHQHRHPSRGAISYPHRHLHFHSVF
jgi:hypothetical protein